MAAEVPNQLILELLSNNAQQVAREQDPTGEITPAAVGNIQLAAEAAIEQINRVLNRIQQVTSGERYVIDLTQEDRDNMREALTLRTGQTIFNAQGEPMTVTFMRNNINIFPSINLMNVQDFVLPIFTQMGSIVMECLALVLKLFGINLRIANNTVKLAFGNARTAVMGSIDLRNDVDQIVAVRDDYNAMGKGIFMLVINMYARNRAPLWDIVRSFFVQTEDHPRAISQNELNVIVGRISSFIGMMVVTDGTAKISKLAMELGNFEYLQTKLNDLIELRRMRNELNAAP